MADILREVFGIFSKRYRDMGDGSHAEVMAVGGAVSSAISTFAVPEDDPIGGQVAIAVTGTAVRLSVASVPLPSGSVLIKALSTNTAMGAAGGSAVTNTVDGTGNGHILEAGETSVVIAADLNRVWVNGTAGDIFTYSAG